MNGLKPIYGSALRIVGRSLLALAVIGGLLAAPAGQAPVLAVDVPTPLTPANGSTTTVTTNPPLAIPEFTWTPVANATSYRIQICPDIACASTYVNVATPNPRYTPSSAAGFADGTWYWHVRVEAPAVGDYSSIMSFNKQWASGDNAPVLTSPADGASLDFYDLPSFSWQPVTGAAAYKLQIDSNFPTCGFASPTTNVTTLAPAYQPPAKLANGSYCWRVIPVNAGNYEGTASAVRTFKAEYTQAPTLLTPANHATPTFTPSFSWTAIRGAQYYRLQYSTDPSFNTNVTTVDTRNTSYTPTDPLPNDVNYYWRVQAYSGNSVTNWSPSRTFVKQWYTKPELLTPMDGYKYVKDPFFSWTPVEGASHYRIEIDHDGSFPPDFSTGWTDWTVNPFYAVPDRIQGIKWNWFASSPPFRIWSWRVTPVFQVGFNTQLGKPSNVASFGYDPAALAPQLIHPLYYYSPTATMRPQEDRTVALPVFMWHRTLSYTSGNSGTPLAAYRLQVAAESTFSSPLWTHDTENLSAAPTISNPFTPTVGGIYYWRVRPLTALTGTETAQWSETWKTRIDTNLALTATSVITLLRPAHGFEAVETAPLLEWRPLQGADSYEVEISADPSFSLTPTLTATVPYAAFTPQTALSYGTYYWRVRGLSGGAPLGTWSAGWRFQVAAQSRWRATRTLGANKLSVATDPGGDMTDPNYDLTGLYAAQSRDFWFFGFDVLSTAADVTYTLYLDIDHVDGSGATYDARGFLVDALQAHRPEYAVYVLQSGGVITTPNVLIYAWTGSSWGSPRRLSDLAGGDLTFAANYVEFQIPNTIIGMQDTTQTAALSLFSGLAGGGHAQDTVPADPNVAFTITDTALVTTTLGRFTSVTERLHVGTPPTNLTGDPTLYPSVPPFFFHFPVDATWYGYQFQAATDSQFTSVSWDYTVYATSAAASPLVPPAHTYNAKDLWGDNTYYWRVRPVYSGNATQTGAWSQPARFERQGFVPQNLQTSVTFATPTFSWDPVEGVRYYDLQVDNDPSFGSPDISAKTERTSYTSLTTLANGTYYWRVRVRRYSSSFTDLVNDWTDAQTFTLNLPQPTNLTHSPPGVVTRAPTLCWDHLLSVSGGDNVLAAYKYRIQLSKDQTFSVLYDTVDVEQACWTPTKGYDDGTYYWRAAMIDGNPWPNTRVGDYTAASQFTKQYPITTLLSPTTGSATGETPTFVWTPVNGAASYKLEVSQSSTFSPLYDFIATSNTRFTPTKAYALGKTYYWRVAIVDKDNKVGPFTNATIIVDPKPYKLYVPYLER